MSETRTGALQETKKVITSFAMLGVLFTSIPAAHAESAPHANSGVARPDGGDMGFSLKAEVDCALLAHPGKVQCIVRLRPVGGTLHFSDAIVLAAPSFAKPLRDRVATRDAERSDDAGTDLLLTLAATADGHGELYVMARATVCSERGCRPVQAEASSPVVVGASSGTMRPR
jgi:hypothetical protein